MKKIEKIASKVIRKITQDEATVWPPVCNGFFHQPERPLSATNEEREGFDQSTSKK